MPNTPFETPERGEGGKPRVLMQDGWKITYDYYPAAENDGLPRRMEVVSEAQTLRLVIDTWRKDAP
jgi:outer membrane biogenesis lipoprotein LolB